MRNNFLTSQTAAEIDKHISRILADLGNPQPPLSLSDALELLRLDLQFYSSAEDGALREVVHKMKVAGKQVIERPQLLLEAVRTWDLKALFLPDKKRILIDKSIHKAKWRWSQAHEVTHAIIPWHAPLMLGDTKLTLTPTCHDQIEAEANYGAGRLLFLQDSFREICRDMPPTLDTIRKLKKQFGNTLTSSLWAYVEQSDSILAGLVGAHPRHHNLSTGLPPFRYLIQSRRFAREFSKVKEEDLFFKIRAYCGWVNKGPLGCGEVMLGDDNGREHLFRFESCSNGYETLTIGVYQGTSPIIV